MSIPNISAQNGIADWFAAMVSLLMWVQGIYLGWILNNLINRK